MKLNSIKYLFSLLIIYSVNVYGQNCTENLETAGQYYDAGQLHLIYDVLNECLLDGQLTREEMIEAYRLLANVSFNLDSTARGIEYLGNILNKSLSYHADESNVFKFRQSLSRLRDSPKLQFGLSMGMNKPVVKVDDIYDAILDRENALTIYGLTEGKLLTNFEEYLGFYVSTVFVKRILNSVDLETGFGYQSTGFEYFDHFGNVTRETRVEDFTIPLLINYRPPVKIRGNTLAVQSGINFSWLDSWRHSDRIGEKLSNNTTAIRSSLNYSWVVGALINWKVGNIVLRPNFQYWMGATPRSEKIADSENAVFAYNDPSFINYNARFNYFIFSIGILKQRF